jgi:hypothetical protein
MRFGAPAVEIPDDRNPSGVGRPDAETDAVAIVEQVRPQPLIQFAVRALPKEKDVEIGQGGMRAFRDARSAG